MESDHIIGKPGGMAKSVKYECREKKKGRKEKGLGFFILRLMNVTFSLFCLRNFAPELEQKCFLSISIELYIDIAFLVNLFWK